MCIQDPSGWSTRAVLVSSPQAIFCIAKGHSLRTEYNWHMRGENKRHYLDNTPVIWVHEPGIYRCQVEHGTDVAYSSDIVVKADGNYSAHLLILCLYVTMLNQKVTCSFCG